MASQPPPPIPRMDWLDYARLACALVVMMGHYSITALDPLVTHGISGFGLIADVTRYGTVALGFFMMMSALVIVLVAQRQSAPEFVASRFARIYPLFLLCMTVTALLSPLGPARFYDSWLQYLANLVIYAPGLGYRYVDTVYWTLVLEFNFYTAMALLIALGGIRRIQTVVTIWILLQVLCVLLRWELPLVGPLYSFFSAGAVMALLYQRRNERLNLMLLGIALMLCSYTAVIWSRPWHHDPLGAVLLTVLVFALFLFMRGRHVTLPWARRIGSMTYPLYLIHFSLGLTIFYRWMDESNKWPLLLGTVAFMIAVSFVIDDLMEFRLRWLWKRIATATVARPFAWWEARAAPRQAAASPPNGLVADELAAQRPVS